MEYVQNWDLRIGGARVIEVNPEMKFEYGSIILVDDILMDYSKMNASYVEIAEYIADIGPFDVNEVLYRINSGYLTDVSRDIL